MVKKLWTSPEEGMNKSGISHEQMTNDVMNDWLTNCEEVVKESWNKWIIHEKAVKKVVKKMWTSCEQAVNKSWKMWRSCKQVINKLWTS